jgi:hypothetical protein
VTGEEKSDLKTDPICVSRNYHQKKGWSRNSKPAGEGRFIAVGLEPNSSLAAPLV